VEEQIIPPGKVAGSVVAPSSKSALQRAIACAALAKGTSVLHANSLCSDARAALSIAAGLGASVEQHDGALIIQGSDIFECKDTHPLQLSCGESGLCMRMFSPIVALLDREVELKGEGTLARRPMQMVETSLTMLGVRCRSNNGLQPLAIHGPISSRSCQFGCLR